MEKRLKECKLCKFQVDLGGGYYSPEMLTVFLMVASFYTDIIETLKTSNILSFFKLTLSFLPAFALKVVNLDVS